MSTAQVVTAGETPFLSRKWIIDSGDDLIWFILSVVASYALLVMYTTLHWNAVLLVFIWAIVFDGPHVFGTFSRTYLDNEERKTRAKLLYGSLLFFAVGPIMVLLSRVFTRFAGAGLLFFFLASIWAYYHLVKQHYGFMVLYKKKNQDLDPIDNFADRFFLLTALTYPFLHYIVYYRYMIADASDRNHLDMVARVPNVLSSSVAQSLDTFVWWLFVVSAVLFGARQIQRVLTGRPLNLPKYLLLAAAIPLHWIVLFSSITIIGIAPVLTIWHNIQYHRLIWFHNKNKYQAKDGAEIKSYGLASTISKHFVFYAICGLLFNFIYHIPRGMVIARDGATSVLASFFWGFAFIHYYLDSKIWRVRRDPSLGKSLKMAQ